MARARARLGDAAGAVVAAELGPVASAIYKSREVVCSGPGRAIVRVAASACERPPSIEAKPQPRGLKRVFYSVFTAGLSEVARATGTSGTTGAQRLARARNALLTGGMSEVICAAGKDKTEMAMDLVCDGNVGRLLPKPPTRRNPYAHDPYTYAYDPRAEEHNDTAACAPGEADALAETLRSPQQGYSPADAKRAAKFIEANGLCTRPWGEQYRIALLFLTVSPQAALALAQQLEAQQGVSGLGRGLGLSLGLFR